MGLKDKFTDEVRQAWQCFCKFGMSLLNTRSAENDSSNKEIAQEYSVSDDQKALVQSSWLKLCDIGLQKFGFIIFKQLIKIKPEVIKLFPFSKDENGETPENYNLEEIFKKDSFKQHINLVMKGLGWAVNKLGYHDEFQIKLQELGKRHVGYGMKPDHIQAFG